MALAKRGSRKIVVDGRQFRWKFREIISVVPEGEPTGILTIDFGWYDVWDYANSKEKPPDFEPKLATPRFVAQGIKYAISKGWEHGKMAIKYRNGVYSTET